MLRLLLLATCAWVAAGPLEAQPSPKPLASARQADRELRLDLQAGDYVRGRAEAAPDASDLVLLGPAGETIRTFRGSDRGIGFSFVAERPGPYRLGWKARAAKGAITATSIAHRADQPRAGDRAGPAPLPSARLRTLQADLQRGGGTQAFWREVVDGGGYLAEPTEGGQVRVTFLWRGTPDTRSVHLNWPVWAPRMDDNAFEHLAGSDVWYRTVLVPPGTRLTYQLAPDAPIGADAPRSERRDALVAVSQTDPLNRKLWPADPALGRFDRYSVVELEGAPPLRFAEPRPDAPRGATQPFDLTSAALAQRYSAVLYRPPGPPSAAPLPLLIVFDADRYLERIEATTILDNMIAQGAIPPVAAVFVANPSAETRASHLACNPKFSDFLADELIPAVRSRLPVTREAAQVIAAGASYGGLAAACAALHRPDAVGAVLSQSGSFWWAPGGGEGPAGSDSEPNWVARAFAARERAPLRFYLNAGVLEAGSGIRDSTRTLRDVLRAKGYNVVHEEFAGGHDDLAWQETFPRGLIALIGSKTVVSP